MAIPSHVCLIGCGEVGRFFARDLKALGVPRITAYDPLFSDPASKPSRNAAEMGAEICPSASDAARGADHQLRAAGGVGC